MSHPLRTAGVLLAASAMTAGVLAAPSSPAAPAARAATDNTAMKIAANWLKDELTNGLIVGKHGTDYGLSIDTGLAMAEAGEGGTVKAISAALEPKLAEYVGNDKAGKDREVYAGATAKAAVFARTAGSNPTSYGGMNLITRLEGQVADTGTTMGRLSDTSQHGDFANVVGQSWAVRALSTSGSKEAKAALDYLLKQQCTSGYFRIAFSKPGDAQQGCVEGAAGSEADADATALAIINLIKAHEKSKPVQDAVDKAAAWLADKQRNSGGVRGGATISKLNTNTTALSGYALGLAKNTDAAMLAARWVRRNQPVDKYKCRTALTRELGAVAYRGSSVSDARSGGISEDARGEWQRATAQAILGLQWAPASPYKLEVRRKWRRVRAGHKPPFKVFGLAPGERGCLQVKGEFKRVTGKKSGAPLTRRLRMPAGNRGRFIIVKTADDRDRTWVRVRNR